ncbi:procathepsin L-like [Bemisia tabaci]
MRLDVYQSNLKRIDGLNAKKLHGVDYGATRFTDQTQDEFMRSHTGLRIDPKYKAKNSLLGLNLALNSKKSTTKKRTKKGNAASQNLQEISDGYFDWREISVAYPSIDDQKKCGVCWAFASAGALQVLASYNADEEIKLSKQQLIDCTARMSLDPGKDMCRGEDIPPSLELMKSRGLVAEADYPFTSGAGNSTGACRSQLYNPIAKITGYSEVSSRAKMEAALPDSPVISCLRILPEFQFYKGGIFNSTQCIVRGPADMDHAVVLIGMTPDTYIFRNSWGAEWGDKGHFYMAKGICGTDYHSFAITM